MPSGEILKFSSPVEFEIVILASICYNQGMTVPDILRILLVITAACLTLLAMLVLFRRQLTQPALSLWVLLAFFPPFLGPILVLIFLPGRQNNQPQP